MKKLFIVLIVFIPILIISSCKNNNNKNKGDKTQQDSVKKENKVDIQTFYLVPSPEDVFGFADDKALQFYSEFLNPINNLNKYNETKSQEFNFGVYSADLAYCAAANRNDETIKYLKVVRELSQDIGLADVFNESLISRIENVTPYKDSLISLSNDTYFDIIRYLERNDRPTTLAIMAAGGWIESMYLVVNQTDYNKNKIALEKIAEQKIIVSNLKKFLEQHLNDSNVKSIYDAYKNIFDLYNSLEVVVEEKNISDSNKDGKIIIVGGKNRIKITEDQFNKLKKYIVETRNKLTQNNVTL